MRRFFFQSQHVVGKAQSRGENYCKAKDNIIDRRGTGPTLELKVPRLKGPVQKERVTILVCRFTTGLFEKSEIIMKSPEGVLLY